jgi:hemolysin III
VNALTLSESAGQADFASAGNVCLIDSSAALPCDFPLPQRSAADELANSVTHGFGFVLATVGAYLMLARLAHAGDTALTAGCCMYLVSLLGVYSMSTMSHAATAVKRKTFYRQLDQGFIYLLIVATYTPYSLSYLHGPTWTFLLGGMWIVAITGFITKVFFAHQVARVSILPPVLLGWAPVLSFPTLMHESPAGAFNMIIAGGVCYTIGIFFLINDERVKNFHAAWHTCVIGGSVCHFYGLLNYVLAV